jgi:hypothetical protein
MVKLAIVNQDGKVVQPQDVASATELVQLVEQARNMIRDCERLARERGPKHGPGTGTTPYRT